MNINYYYIKSNYSLEMKASHSFNFKRKFGKEILNEENIPNIQKKKINKIKNDENQNQVQKKKNSNNQNQKNELFLKTKNSIFKDTFNINKNNNPQFVDEYTPDIIKYIIENESLNILNYSKENLFKLQDNKLANEYKRKNIIELLFYYSYKWKLNNDTIYLAINIMDRYISKVKLNKNEYELIGLSSFFIASKYEDIYSPNASSVSIIYSFKYNPYEILEKEKHILMILDFSLLYNSSYKFLNLIYHLSDINFENVYFLSELILELSLTDINLLKYPQSKRAIAAFLLAKKIFGISDVNYIIQFLFSYNENEIKIIQKDMFILLKEVIISSRQNLIAEKFKSGKYGFIFTILERKVKEKIEKRKNEILGKTLTEKKKNNSKKNQ